MSIDKSNQIAEFLLTVRPTGGLHLAYLDPMHPGRPEGMVFTMPGEAHQAAAWIWGKNASGYNCYWTGNPVTLRHPTPYPLSKPTKSDLAALTQCHADVDPVGDGDYATRRARLLNGACDRIRATEPSFIIDSGNGLQPIYLLPEPVPVEAADEVEALNNGLLELFQADPGTWNADRLLRLPGTVNYANQRKLAQGYPSQSEATILEGTGAPATTLGWLVDPVPPAERSQGGGDAPEPVPLTKSQVVEVEARFQQAMLEGGLLAQRWGGDPTGLNDRSRSGFDLAIGTLARLRGFSYDEFAYLVAAHPPAVSSFDEKGTRNLARSYGLHRTPPTAAEEFAGTGGGAGEDPPAVPGATEATEGAVAPFSVVSWKDITPDSAAPRQLVEEFLGYQQTSLVAAQANTGKSVLSLDLAICVAAGIPWRGKEVEQGAVLYIAAESPATIEARILAERRSRGITHEVPLHVVQDPIKLTTEYDRVVFRSRVEATLRAYAGVNLVILDTFRNATPGLDENSSEAVGPVVGLCSELAREWDLHWQIDHHTTKAGDGYAGSGTFGAVIDTEVLITPGVKEMEGLLRVFVKQQRGLNSKGHEYWYEITGAETGRVTNFGKPETAPVLKRHWSEADLAFRKEELLDAREEAQREALQADLDRLVPVMRENPNHPGRFNRAAAMSQLQMTQQRAERVRDFGVREGVIAVAGSGPGARYDLVEDGENGPSV